MTPSPNARIEMDKPTAAWIASLTHPDATERAEAARSLALAESTPGEAAAELVRALEGPGDDSYFQWVGAALENILSPPADQTIPLREVIERFLAGFPNPDPAYWAATLLGRIGPAADSAVTALAALLERTDQPQAQFKAAWALGNIGSAWGRTFGPLPGRVRSGPYLQLQLVGHEP
jgi:hypothetical protein